MIDMNRRQLTKLIERFVAEDVGRGDITTSAVVPSDVVGRARIEAREPGVVGGLAAAQMCFEVVADAPVVWDGHVTDGQHVAAGDTLAHVSGPLGAILTAERTALNLLGRLSGIATLTARYVDAVAGTAARIVDTRKTTPGLRILEKHAVRMGGGHNHRFGLDDGILIKDNHIVAAGSVTEAVARARAAAPHGFTVEVEVTSLEELDEALAAGADAVLLDNMTVDVVRAAVARAGGKAVLEASGGMTLDTVRAYAEAGVDLISVGALTRSATSLDVALEVES
jgi:nicotinate-nucleotide pyrophosphorylase (carboxylating)